MPTVNKRQHFVSQHYLRQFQIGNTDQLAIALVEPFKFVGAGGISRQCQEDYFYGKDSKLDEILQDIEEQVAPALVRVARDRTITELDLQALRLLAVELHLRTRKASEASKVFPRFMADTVIRSAIGKGELPAPEGGWRPEMMDFDGTQALLLKRTVGLFLETATLRCKLLTAPAAAFFVTSDHPAVALNPFGAAAKSARSFVGFAQSGFQLALPLSPQVCAFLYDPGVYKVGHRGDAVVELSRADVDLLNALQVLSAENCLYAHDLAAEPALRRLVTLFGNRRQPPESALKEFPGAKPGESLLLVKNLSVTLPAPWAFCRLLRRIRRQVGERRDPLFTEMIQAFEDDVEKNPQGGDIRERLDRLFLSAPKN